MNMPHRTASLSKIGTMIVASLLGALLLTAPVAGQIMAELNEHCQAGHDHDAEPMEVVLRRTERTLNTGFFSRRREINQDSSFSVLG